jgi:hypothetical protein
MLFALPRWIKKPRQSIYLVSGELASSGD